MRALKISVLFLIVLFVAGRASLAQQEDVSLLSLRLTVIFNAEAAEIHRGPQRKTNQNGDCAKPLANADNKNRATICRLVPLLAKDNVASSTRLRSETLERSPLHLP